MTNSRIGNNIMKLNIFMKSGNKIEVYGVKNWEIKYSGDVITGLSIAYRFFSLKSDRLIIGSIALSQIEAITRA
jgi:hypothetical protein